MDYNIVVISPPGYAYSAALTDVAELLLYSLESLGRRARIQVNHFEKSAVNIVLGFHLLQDPEPVLTHRTIVYQLEQLSDSLDWLDDARRAILTSADAVWDYSPENLERLAAMGVRRGELVPIGYHPRLERIARSRQPTDVLFYGSVNERRQRILQSLEPDCALEVLFGAFGAERDARIALAKIVLNIHFYPTCILEQVRLAYLLNNHVFVLSEAGRSDPYDGAVALLPYEQLVETCHWYLERPAERHRMARAGYEMLRSRPMSEILRPLLPRGKT